MKCAADGAGRDRHRAALRTRLVHVRNEHPITCLRLARQDGQACLTPCGTGVQTPEREDRGKVRESAPGFEAQVGQPYQESQRDRDGDAWPPDLRPEDEPHGRNHKHVGHDAQIGIQPGCQAEQSQGQRPAAVAAYPRGERGQRTQNEDGMTYGKMP
ncbi:MAG: hypothetical protein A2Z30_07065 [Chloroflexi bacterium RBG_16_64_43]|nr:MAG: hypothetical protein A2Z30_07065 [Chloroflexi bacterium RBG_16_64_43]